ncbi:kelch-like protein 8 [Biomphalaria glabrata]|uniref:BTB domain-containing protein n=1 Tax=Biomphalaria glabrata TaxID=6526 RepID=A0A2C9M437_BIOGL|nr:kelch-like protein 8 [Biomphalaria glabrata]
MSNTYITTTNKISKRIVQSIGKFWQDHENEDFQVNIEDECIKCHSFILASCSEFFRSLLRSNMKEKLEMKVDLQNIPMNIFQLILKTLYTGCELLTKDNVLEVWSAVHQLQIDCLIEHCEDFAIENVSIETLETYKKQAEFLQCDRFGDEVFPFILENFMSIRKTETFYHLDVQEMTKLIESDKLVVGSEDDVLYSIYDWVSYGDLTTPNVQKSDGSSMATTDMTAAKEYVANVSAVIDKDSNKREQNAPALAQENSSALSQENSSVLSQENSSVLSQENSSVLSQENSTALSQSQKSDDRSQYLLQLVNSTRYYLLSEACIRKLLLHTYTQSCARAKNILYEALLSKSSNNPNRFWPAAATHRDTSFSEHVGIMFSSVAQAFSFQRQMWFQISELKIFSRNSKYIDHNGQLYGCINYNNKKAVFHFCNGIWLGVFLSPTEANLLLSHEKCIYFFNSGNKIERFKPDIPTAKPDQFTHYIEDAKYAMSFHQKILVFGSCNSNSVACTQVISWDPEPNVWTHVVDLYFTADNMTSFHDEQHTYLLDQNGHLYRLEHSETIQLTFIQKIWSFRALLKGAVLFKNTLYVCGYFPNSGNYTPEIKNVYSSLTYIHMPLGGSHFIPFTICKTFLS